MNWNRPADSFRCLFFGHRWKPGFIQLSSIGVTALQCGRCGEMRRVG